MEENQRICKKCKKMKLRRLAGNFNSKDKKWVDEHGKLWNGNTCADCHRDYAKYTMRKCRKNEIRYE